jgi:hypothetical protein
MAYCDGTTPQIVGRVIGRRHVYVKDYHYMFYYGQSYLSWSSTNDPDGTDSTFGSENALSGIGVASSLVYDLSVTTDGKYIHLVYLYGGTDIRYCRGTPDGAGGITWDSYQTVASSLTSPRVWSICVSGGYVYIGASAGSSTQHARVWKSSNTVESATWSNDSNFGSSGLQVSTTAVANLLCQIAPMSGGIYCAWATASTGASLYGKTVSPTGTLGSLETISTSPTAADNFGWSIVAYGNEVWCAWEGLATYYYTYVKHRTSGGTWESATQLGGGNGIGADNVTPVLSINQDTGDVFCFYRHTSNYHVYYRKFNYQSQTWETQVDWGASSATGDAGYFGASYNNDSGFVICYFGVNTASPYEVENLALEAPRGGMRGPSGGIMVGGCMML